MTDKQLHTLCTELSNIANATVSLSDLALQLADTNRYQSLKMLPLIRIISDCNTMLSDFAQDIKPE